MAPSVTYAIEICVHNESPRALGEALGRHPGHEHIVDLIIWPHVAGKILSANASALRGGQREELAMGGRLWLSGAKTSGFPLTQLT